MSKTYFWSWEGPEPVFDSGFDEDFHDFFLQVSACARRHYSLELCTAALLLLPALERGEIDKFVVGDLCVWVGHVTVDVAYVANQEADNADS